MEEDVVAHSSSRISVVPKDMVDAGETGAGTFIT